jgi:hypothetical protein
VKTVRELVNTIKVSKVSIYKALKRDDMQEHIIKQDNTTYIDESGEEILVNLFSKINGKFTDINSKVKNDNEILFLREQIKTLNEQIERLTRMNENSQILLLNQQQSLPPPKVGLWDRLFKRKPKD